MKQLNSEQIRTRLAEIDEAQAEHDARDMDAELAAVMKAGGNLDDVEAAQLEAERQSRRLRVEKQALEAALPDAEQGEALAKIQKLAQGMEGHIERFRETAHAIADLIERAGKLEAEIIQINTARCAAHVTAKRLAGKHGLPDSVLGPFRRLTTTVYPFKASHGFAEGCDYYEYQANAIKID